MKRFRPGAINDLKLFQKYLDFDRYIEPIIERFPHYEKSAWCAELKREIINTMRDIMHANRDDGQANWDNVDTDLELIRVYLRRMREKRYLSPGAYEESARRLTEIGKILQGIKKGEPKLIN